MREPIKHCGELNQSQESGGEFFVASADATQGFDAAEEVLHLMAVPIIPAMKARRVPSAALGRDAAVRVLSAQALPEAIVPRAEKQRIIEELWDDLAADDASLNSPAWHEAELRKTEAEFVAGRIAAIDWVEAKRRTNALS